MITSNTLIFLTLDENSVLILAIEGGIQGFSFLSIKYPENPKASRPGFIGKGGLVQTLKSFWSAFISDPLSVRPFPFVPKGDEQNHNGVPDISHG